MPRRILIAPDKFKGTLSAEEAAQAMARGWKKAHPTDLVEILPICDGGDGFGEIIGRLVGAKPRKTKTVDAAHRAISANWWWDQNSKTAVIESAKIIGLAMLPPKKFHPFQLDTFGLGNILLAAQKLGCRHCIIGIGGSATNDGGFGMARSLGWKFLHRDQTEIKDWIQLPSLAQIVRGPRLAMKITVAVDVQNPLLGARGATRIYGPQKGLRECDFAVAEKSLAQLARVSRKEWDEDRAKIPGAGAAGGLGFGLMTFLRAELRSGFEIFSQRADLPKKLGQADLVLTGEGALDQQTLMGKGVGQIAFLCQRLKKPCIGVAGIVTEPERAKNLFTLTRGLTEITSEKNAKAHPARFLEKLIAGL